MASSPAPTTPTACGDPRCRLQKRIGSSSSLEEGSAIGLGADCGVPASTACGTGCASAVALLMRHITGVRRSGASRRRLFRRTLGEKMINPRRGRVKHQKKLNRHQKEIKSSDQKQIKNKHQKQIILSGNAKLSSLLGWVKHQKN